MEQNQPWKILLIDDEPGILRVTAIALRDEGYMVETAENGRDGLAACASFSPHVVITDIRMPEMDGITLLKEIKKSFPEMEVIVATAYGEMELAIHALRLDASDFITKPIDDNALDIAIKRALRRYEDKKRLADYTRFLEEGWNQTTRELMEAFGFEKNLIESSMDGIVGCDEDGIIVIFNKSMERMLGYKKNEIIRKKKLASLFSGKNQIQIQTDMVSNGFGGKNRLFAYESALCTKDGNLLPVQVSASGIIHEGHSNGKVFFFRDLREIRRLEREMEDQASILHQDKMMSLGRLAASVVHEINNPLAGILNYIRLMIKIMSRGHMDDEAQKKFLRYLQLIENETQRCCTIVSGLLTFSRKSPPAFGPVFIPDLIDRCILLGSHKLKMSGIELNLDIPEALPHVHGDLNQLQQCLINLIFNAADAMDRGGVLKIGAEHNKEKDRVTISVADTGTGIAKTDMPRIFEPFYTTKKEGFGVGLGLSTLYGIISVHNGEVNVKSIPGKGTTFYLHLPVK